ncbi:MAG: DUF349 domain-containing protein [bacterium]|nr:DUF349 domain-containing protein [bacterium]
MKKLLSTSPFLFISGLFILASSAFAGGSNVMLDALNTGVINEKGVEVMVTVFEPARNTLDWNGLRMYALDPTGYESIGVMDLRVELQFQEPAEGRYCIATDGGKTNVYGQTKATCFSNSPGDFIVKTNFTSDKPLYDGGRSAKGFVTMVKISFKQKPTLTRPATPPASEKLKQEEVEEEVESVTKEQLEQIRAENEEQKQQIEALLSSVKEQQEEVSALKQVIMKIQAFFERWFARS